MLGLSIVYANAIEGIYKRAVQDCYVWEKISTGSVRTGQVATIPKKDIKTIIDYYDKQNMDKCIFEGYDDMIALNAVAHSTLSFDETTDKMLYTDKRSNRQVRYDFDTLQQLYQKVWNVYEMVLVKNQILRINDVCIQFINRKGSPVP